MATFNPTDAGYTAFLRRFLTAQFDEMGISSYYYEAAKGASFPYVVYELRHTGVFDDSQESRQYTMEINAYANGSDIVLDNLLDHIESAFLRAVYATREMTLIITPGFGRIDIQEPAPLKRKRVLFDLKYWFKEC